MAQSALVSVDTNEFINALVAFCSEKEKEGKEERKRDPCFKKTKQEMDPSAVRVSSCTANMHGQTQLIFFEHLHLFRKRSISLSLLQFPNFLLIFVS